MGMALSYRYWWATSPPTTKQKRVAFAEHRADLSWFDDREEDLHRGKGRRLVVPGIKGARAREQRTRSRR